MPGLLNPTKTSSGIFIFERTSGQEKFLNRTAKKEFLVSFTWKSLKNGAVWACPGDLWESVIVQARGTSGSNQILLNQSIYVMTHGSLCTKGDFPYSAGLAV